jgi:DNA replication protein DnaC
MGDPEKEREELARLGLEPPMDIQGVSLEEAQAIADRKKAEVGNEKLILPQVHEVRNADPTPLSRDDLLRRHQQEERQAEESRAAAQRRAQRNRSHREQLWLTKAPPVFANATVDALPSDLRQGARLFLDSEEYTNLILIGPTGVGKTFTAWAIARELYIEHEEIKIKDAAVLIDELKPGNPDKDKVFNDVKTTPYLVLDDLGVERSTEFATERMHLIFDHRWQWQLRTILTTNIALENFHDVLGDRLASRLLHRAQVALVMGQDRRI